MSTDSPAPIDGYWVWYQRKNSDHWFHIEAESLLAANGIADTLTSEGARSVQIKPRYRHVG